MQCGNAVWLATKERKEPKENGRRGVFFPAKTPRRGVGGRAVPRRCGQDYMMDMMRRRGGGIVRVGIQPKIGRMREAQASRERRAPATASQLQSALVMPISARVTERHLHIFDG
jgi:hypothetical protein